MKLIIEQTFLNYGTNYLKATEKVLIKINKQSSTK